MIISSLSHPSTYFTPLYENLKKSGELPEWLLDPKWGAIWFDAIIFSIFAALVLIFIIIISVRNFEKIPRGGQNIIESIVELLKSMTINMIGPHGAKFLPLIGTLFIYIFIMNLIGIFPGMRSPTMTASITFGLGIATFLMVQFYGIRENGIWNYLKHFMGTIWWLAPLMFIIHIVGEIVKPVSLSLRLFGNIYGEDNVIALLLGLGAPIPIQFPMAIFAIFTSFLQAFIFSALSCIYIATLTAHEEH